MFDVLPESVIGSIQAHIREGMEHAEQGWEGGQADEDSLTGDLGASLRCGWRYTPTRGRTQWRWRVKYGKFRGRGPGAEESLIGADGIFQIEAEDVGSGEMINKGILFQAKKHNDRDRGRLLDQAAMMEDLARNASAVFEYGPDGYRGFNSSTILERDRLPIRQREGNGLGDYLADRFLPCEVGLRGMYYEGSRRTLIIPEETGGYRRIRTRLNHSFRIEVTRS